MKTESINKLHNLIDRRIYLKEVDTWFQVKCVAVGLAPEKPVEVVLKEVPDEPKTIWTVAGCADPKHADFLEVVAHDARGAVEAYRKARVIGPRRKDNIVLEPSDSYRNVYAVCPGRRADFAFDESERFKAFSS